MNKQFPLQKKIEELESIEAYFQRPDMDLDEAMEKHRLALSIAKEITEYLDSAETTIKTIDAAQMSSVRLPETESEEVFENE